MLRRALVAALATVLALPTAAGAHAGFVSSSPSPDTVVEATPEQVVLRFNQAVNPSHVRLFDGVAQPVPLGEIAQPRPNEVVAAVPGTLARGSYTVVWRVISDDVDAVAGFLVFHVGVKRAPAVAGTAGGSGDGGSSIARTAAYALLALAVAGAAAVAAARRAGAERAVRRLAVAVAALVAGVAVSTGLAIALEDGAPRTQPSTFRADVRMGELAGRVSVAPAALGDNRIDLALPEPTGTEGGYFEVRVQASLPAAGIGPFRFRGVQGDDPSRFGVRQAYLPLPGRWTLRITARRGLKGRYAGTVSVPVAG